MIRVQLGLLAAQVAAAAQAGSCSPARGFR